jgi:hypothetical protein
MPVVYRYLYRGTAGDVQLAEELTQTTFEIALRSFGKEQLQVLGLVALRRSEPTDRPLSAGDA